MEEECNGEDKENRCIIINFLDMKTKLFLTVLAITATMIVVNAQNTGNKTTDAKQTEQAKSPGFIDSNNNGVCDNFENSKSNTSEQNGMGYCKMMGKGNGQMKMKGNRNGQGMCKGQGNCKCFTDTDKNGICDMYEARHKSKV